MSAFSRALVRLLSVLAIFPFVSPAYHPDFKIFQCIKFTVHIINGFSSKENPLLVHCWSRDDDLGKHTLGIGGDFNFHFGIRFLPPWTHFLCDLNWGNKHLLGMTVFDKKHFEDLCCKTEQCFWRAQDDGMYVCNNNFSYTKMYDWQQ